MADMAMNPVGWFEIPTVDIMRAKKFYEESFGYELSLSEMGPLKMAMFPMQSKTPGAGGSLVEGSDYKPSHDGTLVYFSVSNLEETLLKIKDSGGKVLTPKTPIGEYGWIAHFEDSEGNRVSVHMPKQ